jgi:hypothetical protein
MIRDYLLDGYSYSFEPISLATEFSTKNTRQRFLYQNRDTIFSVSERLNLAEFAAFEDWVNTTLNGGVDSYTGAYWDGSTQKTGTISIVNGEYSFVYESEQSIVVSYEIELKNRSLSQGEALYNNWVSTGILPPP